MNLFLSQLAFVEAMGMQFFLVEFLKAFLGRKRPNFFALCNYKGYRDTFLSGNYTHYFAETIPGVRGSISNCLDHSVLSDAQKSFPSGHAGTVFSGFGFLGLFLLYLFNSISEKHNMLKGFISFVVFFVAVFISATRPRDYWHNYEDILAGAVIGFACAVFAFMLNFGNSIHNQTNLKNSEEIVPLNRETL